jgi:hypothetical protein
MTLAKANYSTFIVQASLAVITYDCHYILLVQVIYTHKTIYKHIKIIAELGASYEQSVFFS